MKSRCPFADCLNVFDISEEDEFSAINCSACSRRFSVRSLARHQEIDKQSAKHFEQGTLASQFFETGQKPGQFVAVLEEIRSLWNIGSMFRTADAAGFSHLFLIGISGCPPRKEIAKTSLGAEDHVKWNYEGNTIAVLSSLKTMGYQIVALEKTENSKSLSDCLQLGILRSPLCLVLGSEVKGVYAETLDASDIVVDLPMRGFKESLNVAVAFGIAAYAISEKLPQ